MLRATPDLVLLLPQPSRPVSLKQMPYSARMKNPIRSLSAGLLAALLTPLLAHAEFPDRTVKIVVPFDAGGSIDTVARALAQRLNDKWNVPVIVENRPGAGNTIGANAVAKAAPDGYTLLYANTSISTNPSLFKSLPYDTLRDLAPVTYLSPSPNVLLVQKTLGVTTLKDLLALAKSRQDKPLSYASVGKGSAHHFCMELLKSEAGIPLLHVPYRGVAPAATDMVAGRLDMMFFSYITAKPHVDNGTLRMLAIAGAKRHPVIPDVPTMAEAGFPGVEMDQWFGLFAPAGTPPAVVEKLNAEFVKALESDEVQNVLRPQGAIIIPGKPEVLAAMIARDVVRLGQVVRESGAKPE
jgi:tripartite-type tricarboxylate transporter receptor subunit TctC